MSEEEITEPVETANSDDGSGNMSAEELPDNVFQESWMENLPEELQDDSSLGKFKDVASLAKGYKHMESFRGQSISIPEEQTPESMGDIWDKLGRPEGADKYEYTPPDKIPDGEYNFENQNEFLSQAYDHGFTNDQAKFVLDYYNNMAFESINDIKNFQAKASADNTTELQNDWGRAYDENLSTAVRAFNQFATDKDREYLATNGLDSSPTLIRMFHQIGTQMGEGSFTGQVNSDRFLSPAVAQTEIDAIRSDPSHSLHEAYNSAEHRDHQKAIAEVEKLYELVYQEE